jgi:HTH-type transcriptional regulator, transcriptional repressor of NAD biosynthesis genes
MTKRFQRGLVVGKFSPLHRGHELLIRRAMDDCAEVVILSYSKPEFPGCSAERREAWLAGLFPETRRLVVTDERLRRWTMPGAAFAEVPANDAAEMAHRRFCGFLCQQVLGVTLDAVFTSEDYGDGFATELTRCFRQRSSTLPPVAHVRVDPARGTVPVSGSLLRQDIHAHRQWLAPQVYASFVRRVCLLGGESSGKSTLAAALAREFDTLHVAEYGRELWEVKSGALCFEDLRRIAEAQIEREEKAAGRANRFLFCDTSPLTTLFYSLEMFRHADPALEEMASRSYDFAFLCVPDFEFVQDGTRQEEAFRRRQHAWYLGQLASRRMEYRLVTGAVAQRVAQVRPVLSALPPVDSTESVRVSQARRIAHGESRSSRADPKRIGPGTKKK